MTTEEAIAAWKYWKTICTGCGVHESKIVTRKEQDNREQYVYWCPLCDLRWFVPVDPSPQEIRAFHKFSKDKIYQHAHKRLKTYV